jgi:YD repeat-containing protein
MSLNAVRNLIEIAYPEGDTIEYIDHNEVGRVLERVDGNDVHTEYEYNGPQGQLTKIHYPATQALDVTFTYTDEGYRASMTDAAGVTTWQYDELGLPLSVTTQYTGLPSHAISYAYYPDGSRQSMTLPKPGGGTGTIRYNYDKIGRPTSLTTPDGKTARWQYDLKQQRIQQTLGNRAWTRYNYNNREIR